MKKIIFITLFVCVVFSLSAESDLDYSKGQDAYLNEDYYTALIFFARVIDKGSEEGTLWYKTADSYYKVYGEDKLLTELYSISFFYLLEQNPNHPFIEELKSKVDLSLKINRSFIRKTRKQIVYRAQNPSETAGIGVVNKAVNFYKEWSEFIVRTVKKKVEIVRNVPDKFKKGSFGFGLRYVLSNLELLLLVWFLISFLSGVIIPSALAHSSVKRGKGKSLPAAYLLWFHWGAFGIHRFYLGQILRGFLLLITFGGLGIGWFVEAFLLPRYKRKQTGSGSSEAFIAQSKPTASRSSGNSTKYNKKKSLKTKAEDVLSSEAATLHDDIPDMDFSDLDMLNDDDI